MTGADNDRSQAWNDGLAIYTDMFGEDPARRRLNSDDPADRRLTDLLMEQAYGAVWSNQTLSRRERSLITIALLAGLGRTAELNSHIEAARRNGCTMAELHEVMVHTGLYCGFPAAICGHKALKDSESA